MIALPQASHYAYRVEWSPEDGEFVARVLEFPSLSWFADTQVEALSGLGRLVEDVIRDMAESGEAVPQPLTELPYSGRFALRMSPDLHRRLAIASKERGMSLNKYINDKLAVAQ